MPIPQSAARALSVSVAASSANAGGADKAANAAKGRATMRGARLLRAPTVVDPVNAGPGICCLGGILRLCDAANQERKSGKAMRVSDQTLIVILVVGLIVGWLAGKVVRGNGFGLVGDAAIGIVGALVGDWLLHRFGVHFAPGLIGLIINATIGAVVLLLALRLAGASGWGAR